MASDGKTPAAPAGSAATDVANERGVPALFSWGDFNGDGRLDLAAVSSERTLQVLVNAGDGHFEDVTERVGLSEVGNAALASWADYDGDGRLDLFVGAHAGASRLFHNEPGEVFIDLSARSGLSSEGAVESAQWFDYDGDGRLDLFVVTAEKNELFRGFERGFFELVELPLASSTRTPSTREAQLDSRVAPLIEATPRQFSDPNAERGGPYTRGSVPARPRGSGSAAAVVTSATPSGPHTAVGPPNCFPGIMDQAVPANCLVASTTPTLGLLYPISANLFVATGGNVGIGTTSPAAKLDVAGTARMTGTLTLNPAVDQALDVSTGSIYKGGTLFIHTKGGMANTALGRGALVSVTTGSSNTAGGYRALYYNTTGASNTASGDRALSYNTSGSYNSAAGTRALFFNTIGSLNTASGFRALSYNTTGDSNTANGDRALSSNTSGNRNTASGDQALRSNTTGSFNTASGSVALFSNTSGIRNTASGYRALFSNTTGDRNTASGDRALTYNTTGSHNTASGDQALYFNTTGNDNTASGYRALEFNTTGYRNTASGVDALRSNTSGNRNTASGYQALFSNTTGVHNTASGYQALRSSTFGADNTAIGFQALYNSTNGHRNAAFGRGALSNNTTGDGNIALGNNAGAFLTTGSDNITIGHSGFAGNAGTIRIGTSVTHTKTFIAGIRGLTTTFANAIPVLIDSAGQLGTVSSSRRFKKDIADMGDATQRLLELRPVVFRYKQEQKLPSGEVPVEYGLIAEEVAEIFPDLVVYDDDGKPFTVKYHLLSSMLLNEMKKQALELEEQRSELARLRGLEARLDALESRTNAPVMLPTAMPAGNR